MKPGILYMWLALPGTARLSDIDVSHRDDSAAHGGVLPHCDKFSNLALLTSISSCGTYQYLQPKPRPPKTN